MRKIDHHHCSGPGAQCDICGPDSRDAEIARLKAQIDEDNRVILAVREQNRQLRAALAAGPAALRAHGRSEGHLRVASMDGCAVMVEAAQAAAMKEGDRG